MQIRKFWWIQLLVISYCISDQVTEQARSSIEARMKEAEQQRHRLEEKLLEAEKEKEDLVEQQRRTQASLEEQVLN